MKELHYVDIVESLDFIFKFHSFVLPDSGLGEDEADTGMFMSVSSENAVIIDLNNISPSPPTSFVELSITFRTLA